jgi:hypothetical protein
VLGGPGGSPGTSGTGGTSITIGTTGGAFKCHKAVAQSLPARAEVMSDKAPPPTAPPTTLTITKQDLFSAFTQTCGTASSCHVGSGGDPNSQPPNAFRVTLDTFDQRKTLGDEAIQRVTSSNPADYMPPSPYGYGSATPGTTVYDLADHLQQWQQKHFPDTFTVPLASGPTQPVSTQNPYLLSPDIGKALTNIGWCVPDNLTDAVIMGDDLVAEMQKKDDFFAGLNTSNDLPTDITDTDLVTLDSTQLAQYRVFSYAPTYPLYSDNAGKMRYVRVPVGESIHYDDTLHDFVIPDNTRFYKTFLKQVKDKDGNIGWRKMETRLIVVRQDTQNSDGSYTTHALRASYAWDKDEQMAHRVTDPFNDGTPARDRLCPYVTDESVTRDPTTNPISDQISSTCEYMTQDEMNDPKSGHIRHYAIPSTQRCDQCHMGSSSHSFILGFTPWQVDRRQSGDGGTYEDPNDDELTQLQRFLDYGIITGVKPGQVKLEESQLIANPPRSPRNDHELKAQAYMMGNCAFCHNPHGFPVVTNPQLKEFELFPSETGGVFQFPLEKFSPRAKAGVAQSLRFPYITPGFGDFILDGSDTPEKSGVQDTKMLTFSFGGGVPVIDGDPSAPNFNPDSPDYNANTGTFTFLGPWRSLIWRNTYTPFTYNEDGTIFIHMPRNAAGFDCRVQHIMAEWMLSIPARQKGDSNDPTFKEQAWEEVSSADPTQAYAYSQAVLAGKQRIQAYSGSVTGQWCPDDDDLVDPKVILSPVDQATGRKTREAPQDDGISGPRVNPDMASQLKDSVPNHDHWIPTDTTQPPGKWVPRRSNWKDYLVTRTAQVSDSLNQVIDLLQGVHLSSDLEQLALTPLPMGLWHPQCQDTSDAQNAPTVGDLLKDQSQPLRRWLSGGVVEGETPPSDPKAHVHLMTRGQAVFQGICQNCHGKAVDSKSPLASTILEITGGNTRVADFVDGLFGPATAPGAYAKDEFLVNDGATPDDWQSRYVLFMGLGGTGAEIPIAVLNLVATSPFYGVGVTAPGASTPNMLGSAQQFCFYVLGGQRNLPDKLPLAPEISSGGNIFAGGTGHYELWESLCTFNNPPVVRVFNASGSSLITSQEYVYRATDDTGASIYPPDALVGNQRGEFLHGIDATNTLPWCIKDDPDSRARAETLFTNVGLSTNSIPYCPDALFTTALGKEVYKLALSLASRAPQNDVPLGNQDFSSQWMLHGAMNAGLSAFYFMRGFTNHSVTPAQTFDFCLQ